MSSQRRYQIHHALGSGAFGTVYRATLTSEGGFQKEVAIKVLNDDVEGWDEIARRLRDEARMLGLLRHRALLQVDGLVQVGGRWAVVMEYVKGASLLALLKSGRRMPVGAALELVGEVAGALSVAWDSPGPDGEPLRLVHRDIKPSNIQLSAAGEAKLLDFGIARAEFGDRESETREMVLGSPGYMAPERFDMEDGPEGDVYSLGVTLCELLSARKFGRTSANLRKHQAHIDDALARVRKKVPESFDAVEGLLRAMLAYEASDRPTAKEVERMARSIRAEVGGMWLAEFCEEVIPDLTDAEDTSPDELCGQTLLEGTGGSSFTSEVAAASFKNDEGTVRVTPLQLGAAGAALLLGIGGFALVLGLVILGSNRPATAPEPDGDATTEVDAAPVPDTVPPDPTEAPDPGDEAAADEPEPTDDPVAVVQEPPAPAETDPPPPEPAEPPPPREVAAPAGSTPRVTAAQFAAWLAEHPQWSRDVAQAEGRADANYLMQWTNGTPPDPSAYATEVTWGAAAAYCGSRGLPDLDAAPHTWAYPAGPFVEYRVSDGKPAWRQYDGMTSTVQPRNEATAFVGFRCAN